MLEHSGVALATCLDIELQERYLVPYAAFASCTRGRQYEEPISEMRTAFQRDRDRIVHCTAFRRLEYKTQVFVNDEGDLFRTRLTHSLEVAQIGRSLARILRVNEDLVEAITLAHDLGHTPFGHAGQDALNACMKAYGGFEHNLQSLTIVDELENHYAQFKGLNLCFETREGILKHCSKQNALRLGELGLRFLQHTCPSIEAQIANIADSIAYNHHDIDDGIRSHLISVEQLAEVPIWCAHYQHVLSIYPNLAGRQAIYETTRRMINAFIVDLVEQTMRNIQYYQPHHLDEVRQMPVLVEHSEQMHEQSQLLQQFLFDRFYRHHRVMRMSSRAKRVVSGLFDAFMQDQRLLPVEYQKEDPAQQPRWIAHYISGMTDRFAIKEYQQLYLVDLHGD